MSLSAGEQYLLELINRARLDPAAEAARYNVDLNDGLTAGTIGTNALQVLSPNGQLESAAGTHSSWMLQYNTFSHSGDLGSNAGDRIEDNDYTLQGSWGWRENLAWFGSTGNIDLESAIEQHHEGLYNSESHRTNTFAADMREIGIGQEAGKFTYNGTTYNSSMLTENFAKSGTKVFVTGVAFRDKDGDEFYSIGEGRDDVWIEADRTRVTTADAGGYGISVDANAAVAVKVGIEGRTFAKLEIDLTEGNAKVDLMNSDDGDRWLLLSASSKLGSGITNARLLGVGDLNLTGSYADNTLSGNKGDNLIRGHRGDDLIWGNGGDDELLGNGGVDILYGGKGNDYIQGGGGDDILQGNKGDDSLRGGGQRDFLKGNQGDDRLWGGNGNDKLWGGTGHDTLTGGRGNDRLEGQAGNDRLIGGEGKDVFVFVEGRDRISDFEDNGDTIYIREELGVGGSLSFSDLIDTGKIRNGNAIFDFGDNNVLTIEGIENLNILINDMVII
jgi:Ca2+-binding RTX toxin-like protein